MNETLIKEALVQAPSLCVLVVVVFLFLRFMERLNQSLQQMMKELTQQHIDERVNSRRVIEENSQVLREFIEAKGRS